ncbi:hypothetical protein D3C85_1684890 [compost metagenome]
MACPPSRLFLTCSTESRAAYEWTSVVKPVGQEFRVRMVFLARPAPLAITPPAASLTAVVALEMVSPAVTARTGLEGAQVALAATGAIWFLSRSRE